MTQDLKQIAISDILEPSETVRTIIVMERLSELAESIKQKGVIQPIIVKQKDDKYEVVAGHRRYLAAKMAGLEECPCIIRSAEDLDIDMIKVHENYGREDINPVDEGKFFVKLHDKHQLSYNEIAKMCARSEAYIATRLRLLQIDEAIQAALEGELINISQALEICKANDEKIRHELLRITIESGATVASLRLMRHDFEMRLVSAGPAGSSEAPESREYQVREYLYKCPICEKEHPVTEIYPISVCKGCHNGFMEGLKGQSNE